MKSRSWWKTRNVNYCQLFAEINLRGLEVIKEGFGCAEGKAGKVRLGLDLTWNSLTWQSHWQRFGKGLGMVWERLRAETPSHQTSQGECESYSLFPRAPATPLYSFCWYPSIPEENSLPWLLAYACVQLGKNTKKYKYLLEGESVRALPYVQPVVILVLAVFSFKQDRAILVHSLFWAEQDCWCPSHLQEAAFCRLRGFIKKISICSMRGAKVKVCLSDACSLISPELTWKCFSLFTLF